MKGKEARIADREELASLLAEFNRIGNTLPVWAERLIDALRYEWAASYREADTANERIQELEHPLKATTEGKRKAR